MTDLPTVVPVTADDATVTITGHLTHQCPFVDEVDEGTVSITWQTTAGETLELHSLGQYLAGFKDDAVAHEELTARIFRTLGRLVSILDVTTTWTTGGLAVTVQRRDPHWSGK